MLIQSGSNNTFPSNREKSELKMNIDYKTTTVLGKLRTVHILVIDGESLTTTRQREVLVFAKPRIRDKFVWKQFKEAVRLGQSLTIRGGQ